MNGTMTFDGTTEATREAIEQRLAARSFFWLDLDGVDEEAHDLLLDGVQGPPAGGRRRPELRPAAQGGGLRRLHLPGGPRRLRPTRSPTEEVHFIFAEHFVITVHRGPCPAMDECTPADRHRKASRLESPQIALIYLIIDQLVDSFFPMLDQFDTQIDELEDAILVKPTDAQLGTLFTMKRR